jgi:hypothetical protein
MDQLEVLADLTQAERHVASGEIQIYRQRNIIFRIERSGRDTSAAIALLGLFLELQELHIARRSQLRLAFMTAHLSDVIGKAAPTFIVTRSIAPRAYSARSVRRQSIIGS